MEKTFFTGFGGQGIVSLGELWAYSCMKEGLNVTFFPSYGAEKRGGITRANVIVDKNEIASPLVNHADSVICMNQDSLSIAEKIIKIGGTLIVNSSLVNTEKCRKDIKIIKIPANEIAKSIGNVKTANSVMFGALSAITKYISFDNIKKYLNDFFPEDKKNLVDINLKATLLGKQAYEVSYVNKKEIA